MCFLHQQKIVVIVIMVFFPALEFPMAYGQVGQTNSVFAVIMIDVKNVKFMLNS